MRHVPTALLVAALLAGCGGEAEAPATAGPSAPVLMPGGPGEPARTATPGQELPVPDDGPAGGDVEFLSRMIPHHRQALEMASLAPERASDQAVTAIAERIAIGQEPEVAVMSQWLRDWGEPVPPARGPDHHGARMPGMATEQQMAQLEAATGTEFDRLFLELMIAHHEGALEMVDEAVRAGTSVPVEQMVSEVAVVQAKEIEQMRARLP